MNKIHVIGIGYRPLNSRAKEILHASEIILANERLREIFKRYDEFDGVKDRIKIINTGIETIEYLKKQKTEHPEKLRTGTGRTQTIALLADGDPMFYGIGKMLVKEFGRDSLEVYPDLSSMQVAFSRIKEPWGEAFLMSLHGGPDPQKRRKLQYEVIDIPELLQKHRTIGILTDRTNNPTSIAEALHSSPVAHRLSLTLYVCERLGYPDEKITDGMPQDIAALSFSHPNVVIIRKKEEEND